VIPSEFASDVFVCTSRVLMRHLELGGEPIIARQLLRSVSFDKFVLDMQFNWHDGGRPPSIDQISGLGIVRSLLERCFFEVRLLVKRALHRDSELSATYEKYLQDLFSELWVSVGSVDIADLWRNIKSDCARLDDATIELGSCLFGSDYTVPDVEWCYRIGSAQGMSSSGNQIKMLFPFEWGEDARKVRENSGRRSAVLAYMRVPFDYVHEHISHIAAHSYQLIYDVNREFADGWLWYLQLMHVRDTFVGIFDTVTLDAWEENCRHSIPETDYEARHGIRNAEIWCRVLDSRGEDGRKAMEQVSMHVCAAKDEAELKVWTESINRFVGHLSNIHREERSLDIVNDILSMAATGSWLYLPQWLEDYE